jgi:hypothetical protein
MKGTKFGPVVVPGIAISSSLYLMISSKTDPKLWMPHEKPSLSSDAVASIETWIDQGAREN